MTARLQRIKMRAQRHRPLLTPLMVCVTVRLALMVAAYACTGTQVMTQGDTVSYLAPGINLFTRGSYAVNGWPELDRTPGYPVFLMLAGMMQGNVLLAVFAQIVISSVSMLLVAKIAERVFFNGRAGVVAAWLFALEPLGLIYTIRLMPETLFVAFILAALERLSAFLRNHQLSLVAAAGVLLAASAYVRPVSYYLVLPLAAGLALTAGKQRRLRWKAPAVLLLTTIPLIALWQIRNFEVAGYRGFSSIVEKNLYFYQSAEISAEAQHRTLEQQQSYLGYTSDSAYLASHPEQHGWSQSQRLGFMKSESIKVIWQHAGLYSRSHFAGVAVVLFTPGSSELLQLIGKYPESSSMPHRILNEGIFVSLRRVALTHPVVIATMVVMEAFLIFLYLSAIRGCLTGPGMQAVLLMLAGTAMYFLLISGGAQAVARYRLPVMPIVCILAAGGIAKSKTKARIPQTEPGPPIHAVDAAS